MSSSFNRSPGQSVHNRGKTAGGSAGRASASVPAVLVTDPEPLIGSGVPDAAVTPNTARAAAGGGGGAAAAAAASAAGLAGGAAAVDAGGEMRDARRGGWDEGAWWGGRGGVTAGGGMAVEDTVPLLPKQLHFEQLPAPALSQPPYGQEQQQQQQQQLQSPYLQVHQHQQQQRQTQRHQPSHDQPSQQQTEYRGVESTDGASYDVHQHRHQQQQLKPPQQQQSYHPQPRQQQQTEYRDVESTDGASYDVLCWACGLCLSLPSFSPNFKCGYCGALTLQSPRSPSSPSPSPPSSSAPVSSASAHSVPDKPLRQRRCRACIAAWDMLVLTVVILLITFIIVGGILTTFPVICPLHPPYRHHSPPLLPLPLPFLLHSLITLLLSLQTIFNFLCSALLPAGPVKRMAFGSADLPTVSSGSFDGWRLCRRCHPPRAKPPGAHHCGSCGTCVMDMDHHCPFIGNCVGRANQRHFLLFLLSTILSCSYVCLMAATTLYLLLPTLDLTPHMPHTPPADLTTLLSTATKAFAAALWAARKYLPIRALIAFYLFTLALGTGISVSLLLYQQLDFILSGEGGYVDSLKAKKGAGNDKVMWEGAKRVVPGRIVDRRQEGVCSLCGNGVWTKLFNRSGVDVYRAFRGVFGSGSPWFWCCPRVRAPRGSLAANYDGVKDL
ncbi:hypothetical protein CLOM_g3235 [Closterium sp. NIES-68]|nr:hypothetical protein CLOM_g3235 [Closterium sp. NIES-68]GJP76383.1 hypothetical protein CLOP_g6837 [Closterium sp. NIES-67]